MNNHPASQSGKMLLKVGIPLAAVVVIAVVGFASLSLNLGDTSPTDQPVYLVQEGPLTISSSVAGTIQAREKEIIKSELEGSNAILYIVPEGSKVTKDQLLVELDASTLQDQRVDQQISVQNAEAAFISARENMEIVKNQAQSDVEKAELTYELAVLDLEKYEMGDYPKAQKEAETNIILGEEEVNRAADVEKWSKVLFEEKYLSQTELQRDTITAKKAKLSLDLANVDLELLNRFDYKRQVSELKSNVSQASMALEREKRKASANIVQASAELQAKKSEYDQQVSKLKKIEDQIGKAKIYAPTDGLVVYATSVRGDFFRNQEPLEEGQMVRERQELIHLPTTSSYIAEVKVHESSLEKIFVGLPTRITIDALPGKVYVGRITSIAPLPDAQSVFMNPDLKVYRTEILIEGPGEDLRSGMSCQAEIIIDQFENTTYIPVQAIVRSGNKPTVYVMEGGDMTPRTVELGPDNNRLAQIKSGLKKGEMVLLTPPLATNQDTNGENQTMDPGLKQMLDDSRTSQNGQEANPAAVAPEPAAPAVQAEGGPNPAGMGVGGPGGGGRPDFSNMTEEERAKAREAMRKQFESLSPEQQEQMRQRFGNRGGGAGGPGGAGSGAGQGPRGPQSAEQ
ncbi:MAG: efflux RND transporter periplasmic adaptor subunit [bacterium]|nr:efflux RND transporter periplasmic adaptor subunit [bacterium]